MGRRNTSRDIHNTFHGDAHTVVQAGVINRIHVYGIPVHLTPLPGRAAFLRCAVVVLLAVSGGVLLALGLTTTHGRRAPWLVLAGLAVLMAAHAAGSVTRQRWLLSRGRFENVLRARVNGVIAGLADEQERRWRDETIIRRVQGSRLLPVLCRTAEPELFDHWSNIRSGQHRDDPLDLDGDVADIDQLFARVPTGRLVILGEPGAGKSIAALRLGLRYLQLRDPDDRVPVILPLATWDPAESGLWRWVARRLATEHPELAAPTGFGTTLVSEVANPERLLLILDGFDEIPAERRPAALMALNDGLGEQTHLVLTSRTAEYREAVRQADVLSAAAAVTLQPLTVDELSERLRTSTRRTRQDGSGPWDSVVERVRQGEDQQARSLRAVLSSPLMLGLALTVYGDANADPAELLDPARFPTATSMENHLIGRLIPAVYSTPRDVGRPPRWRAREAQRWLGQLAADASRHGGQGGELAWWAWYRRQTTIATAGAVALVYVAAVVLTAALPVHGTVSWLGIAVPPWAALALIGALPLVVAVVDVQVTAPAPVRPQLRRRLPATLVRVGVSAVGVAFAWLTNLPDPQHPYRSGFPISIALVLGTVFVARAVPVTTTDVAVSTPRSLLHADRASALALAINYSVTGPRRWCLEAVVLLPIPILVTWADHAGAGRTGPAIWATVIAAAAVITVAHGLTNTAWGRFTAARVVLAATGRLPWRAMTFLDDAHTRGVLRQSGGTFQFRHARLLHHLVGDAPQPRPRTILPRPAAQALRRWPAPILAGIVLLLGAIALTNSAGRVVRPAGPYLALSPACSLLDTPTLTAALHGPPVRDHDAPVDGGLYKPSPPDDNVWCSWHTPANNSKIGLAVDLASPTNDETGAEVAQDDFAWATTGPGTTAHLDLAAVPCDWGHEFEWLIPSEANSGHSESILLLCQNVLIEIDCWLDRSSDTYGETQRLLHAAVAEALGAGGKTQPRKRNR